jgi:hypothetical protein
LIAGGGLVMQKLIGEFIRHKRYLAGDLGEHRLLLYLLL